MSDSAISGDELVNLAKSSLALGDSGAAFELLEAVDVANRNNGWRATQVQALRLHAKNDAAIEFGQAVLFSMMESGDWFNARTVLVEVGRALTASSRNRTSIEFLHSVELQLRDLSDPEPIFRVQLFCMLASRIAWAGDLTSASHLLAQVEVDARRVSDRRALASYLWVQSDLAGYSGDANRACDLMERVILLHHEANDALAMRGAIQMLAALAVMYIGANEASLMKARYWVSSALAGLYGQGRSTVDQWLSIHAAWIELKLGDPTRAMEMLVALESYAELGAEELWSIQLLRAKCEISRGHLEVAARHLEDAESGFRQSSIDVDEQRDFLRELANAYMEIGEQDKALQILDETVAPVESFAWCVPKSEVAGDLKDG